MHAVAITPVLKRRALVLAGMLALSCAALGADGALASAGGGLRNAPRALDRRVELLARELDLDTTQKLKVRALLEGQREQIVQVWQDESIPGGVRVARTQAISERTEDGIRALLTEAQRQKYLKPHPDRATMGATADDVETYLDKMNRR